MHLLFEAFPYSQGCAKENFIPWRIILDARLHGTPHSGLACVNFVFQIHTTQKVFWPLKIIIQIVFKWFWMIVPNFNYFEAIFVFLTNCCCHLPYESEDLKPPKACPRLLRAVKWSKRKSCILIKFIILEHKKAGLGRPS